MLWDFLFQILHRESNITKSLYRIGSISFQKMNVFTTEPQRQHHSPLHDKIKKVFFIVTTKKDIHRGQEVKKKLSLLFVQVRSKKKNLLESERGKKKGSKILTSSLHFYNSMITFSTIRFDRVFKMNNSLQKSDIYVQLCVKSSKTYYLLCFYAQTHIRLQNHYSFDKKKGLL